MRKQTTMILTVGEGQDAGTLSANLSETAVGDLPQMGVQTAVTTSWAALELGGVTVPDWLMVKNADATNYVELAIDNAGTNKIAKLTAGRAALFPPIAGVTYYVQAHTANCKVRVLAAPA